jgi:hypothetical protein
VPRIALIHALAHSPAPINAALAQAWPQAERMNLLDDSLSADLARTGRLDAALTQRFITLADYAVATGAQAILFTCSAFGPCIDAVKQHHPGLPVLKPNEAMVDEAQALWRDQGALQNFQQAQSAAPADLKAQAAIGLIASFGPTLQSMPAEFAPDIPLRTALAVGAMDALNAGDTATHDRAAADAAEQLLAQGCGVVALAQFSLARAAPAVRERLASLGYTVPVLTTVHSAVARLRQALA